MPAPRVFMNLRTFLTVWFLFLLFRCVSASSEQVVSTPALRRAALENAHAALEEMVYGVKIDSTTPLRDFLAEHEEMEAQSKKVLEGALVAREEIQELSSVKMTIEVAVDAFPRAIRKYLQPFGSYLRAEGFSSSSPNLSQTSATLSIEFLWENLIIESVTDGPAPKNSSDDSKAEAEREAYVMAMKDLAEQLEKVSAAPSNTLRDLAEENETTKETLKTFIQEKASAQSVTYDATGAAQIKMQLPLLGLPDLLGLRTTVERFPSEEEQIKNRLASKKAARRDAWQRLTSTIYECPMKKDSTVQDYLAERESVSKRVDDAVLTANVIREIFLSDGSCQVELEFFPADLPWGVAGSVKKHLGSRFVVTGTGMAK